MNSSLEKNYKTINDLKTRTMVVMIIALVISAIGIFLSIYVVLFALAVFTISGVLYVIALFDNTKQAIASNINYIAKTYTDKNWPIPYVTLIEDYDPSVADKQKALILDEDNAFLELDKYKKYLNNVVLELYAIESFSRDVMDVGVGIENVKTVVGGMVEYFNKFDVFNGRVVYEEKVISFNEYSENWVTNINQLEKIMRDVNEEIKTVVNTKLLEYR